MHQNLIRLKKTAWLFVFLSFAASGQNSEYTNVPQYKKPSRDAIADIARGDYETAIESFKGYLNDYPDDLESLFGMAVAYSVMNDVETSMRYAEKAIQLGLPVERFIAGPRNLLTNLVNSVGFTKIPEEGNHLLLHGPMLGAINGSQARVWVRTGSPAKIEVEIQDIQHNWQRTFTDFSAPETDFTAVVLLNGLNPETEYDYRVFVDGSLYFAGGHFRTLPSGNKPLQLKIGFGGGAGYTPWYERMWDTLLTHRPDAFFLLGDNVYIDHPEVPEVQQYCYYRRQSRPEFRRFVSEVPVYAIWDDHDFTINDGEGGPERDEPPWKIPVWELFKNQWNNPYYGGGDDHPGCWFDVSMGDIDFFFLDCRYYRENPQTTEDPSMLGKYQKEWLKEKLKASEATFKVIASSVPWARGTKPGSDDTWDGFPKEREEIFRFLEDEGIEGVILLAADRHRSDAREISRPEGYNLYEFMSSRLTNMHTHKIMPGSIFGYNKTCSFGMLEFDTSLEDPTISYSVYSIDNELIHKITLYRSQLEVNSKSDE